MKTISFVFLLTQLMIQPCYAIVSHGINYPDTLKFDVDTIRKQV
jgi:hypothetical protein